MRGGGGVLRVDRQSVYLLEIGYSGVTQTRSDGHGTRGRGSLVERLPSMLEALDSCLAT